jgi:hypothetical protein
LLAALSTIVRNTCRPPRGEHDTPSFALTTLANATQQRALELLRRISV